MESKPSSEQQIIIERAHGHFLVRACPGSGKTYTIAARVVKDIHSWTRVRQGIAVLSFTNAARDELLQQVTGHDPNTRVTHPHYLGTIDSFINSFIFLPFVDLAVALPRRPVMIGEPFGFFRGNNKLQEESVFIQYDLTGEMSLTRSNNLRADQKPNVLKAKKALLKGGFFTQADANSLALRIVRDHPWVAKSLAQRFPYIYLDEAQDTTAIHWEILKIITAQAGNEVFGVIGDPDQAIYEWNGAEPVIFTTHESKLIPTGQAYRLMESRRSSQTLCDFYHPLSTLPKIPSAITPGICELKHDPEILTYPDDNMTQIIARVDGFIGAAGDDTYFILSKSLSLIRDIKHALLGYPAAAGLDPWSTTYDSYVPNELLRIKFEYEEGAFREAFRDLDKLLLKKLSKDTLDEALQDTGVSRKEWYAQAGDIIRELPSLSSINASEWAKQAQQAIKGHDVLNGTNFLIKNKSSKLDYPNTPIIDFFVSITALNDVIGTVHSVKGRTADQVLLVLSKSHVNKLIKGYKGLLKDEAIRIFYVGITRARKKVIFCIPESTEKDFRKALALSKLPQMQMDFGPR